MSDQRLSYAVTPEVVISDTWLPASYRAYAVQQDEAPSSRRARARRHVLAASRGIDRIRRARRSAVVAAMLALMLGPLGMMYASSTGAIVIAFFDFIALSFFQPLQLALVWFIGVVWAVVAVVMQRQDANDSV